MPICPKCKKHFGNYGPEYDKHIATCGILKKKAAAVVLDTPLEIVEMEKVLAQRELEFNTIIDAKEAELVTLREEKLTLEKSIQGYKGSTGSLQKMNAVRKEEIATNKKAFTRMKKLLVPHSNETFEWQTYSTKAYKVKG